MRTLLAALAVVALVAIGTAEAAESARQLEALPGRGRPSLQPTGAALTGLSLALSSAVYLVLGWLVGRRDAGERVAVVTGLQVGVVAGVIGGTLRALAVHEYLGDVVGRFGLASELATWSLVVFVGLSVIASAVGGGALTWLGFRLSPSSRRPPS